jgi:hypothetical protein
LRHVECISDFAGSWRSPGHAADIMEREDGSRFIALSGWWVYYHERSPEFIEDKDQRFLGFIEAASTGDDIEFVRNNW